MRLIQSLRIRWEDDFKEFTSENTPAWQRYYAACTHLRYNWPLICRAFDYYRFEVEPRLQKLMGLLSDAGRRLFT